MDWYSVTTYKIGRGWNFSSRPSRMIIMLMVTGFLCSSVALGSAFWQHMTSDFGSTHSGLWKLCILNKCDMFLHHAVYEWFHIAQSSWVISFFAHAVGSFLFLAQMFSKNLDEMPWNVLKLISLFCFITSVSLSLLAVLLYGINQGNDPSSLSWGYGIAVLTSIVQGAIVVLFIFEYSTSTKKNHTQLIGSQEMVLLQYPIHLEDEHVLFNRETDSTELMNTPKDDNAIEVGTNCDAFSSMVDSSNKQPSKSRKISITSVRERSSTLDNSYNSCNFPDY